jgi:hypothetical protein
MMTPYVQLWFFTTLYEEIYKEVAIPFHITPLCENHFQEIYPFRTYTLFKKDPFTKLNPFFIIFREISPYFEAEKVSLFHKNLVRTCSPWVTWGGDSKDLYWYLGCWLHNPDSKGLGTISECNTLHYVKMSLVHQVDQHYGLIQSALHLWQSDP